MKADDLLEIAQELVVLRFFMATAISTLRLDKKGNKETAARMVRLAELEELCRREASGSQGALQNGAKNEHEIFITRSN